MIVDPFDQFIVFLYTQDLEATSVFYSQVLGLHLVRDQGNCRIFRSNHGAYLGFCTHLEAARPEGIILTLVTQDVDGWAASLRARGIILEQPPLHNEKYRIHHFFLRDPNGYRIEIQRFDEPLDSPNK
jgi:catechol 2,3-dioxygenase-like lactoylglutathione lyase family enzyme